MLRGNRYIEDIHSLFNGSCNCCNISSFAQKSAKEIFGEKMENGTEHNAYKVKWRQNEMKWLLYLCMFQFLSGIYLYFIY